MLKNRQNTKKRKRKPFQNSFVIDSFGGKKE